MAPQLLSVNVAAAQPLSMAGRTVLSGIRKQAVTGSVRVSAMGLAGDEQADPSVHGGLSKAVHAYPVEHYPFWQTVRAQARVAAWDDTLHPGALGENLTLRGLLENQVWVGDVLRFAHCELAVSEPRFPCDKLNAALGFAHAASLMRANAWCGFYLAVRSAGEIKAGEDFELVPGPREVGITELFRARVAVQRR